MNVGSHNDTHGCGNCPSHLWSPGWKAACGENGKGSVDLRIGETLSICVSRGHWADATGAVTLGQQLRLGQLQGEFRDLLHLETVTKAGTETKQWT